MQDDLKELLRDLATKFEGQGGKHYTAALFGECADRIASLEAKLAETADLALLFQQETLKLAALLRECGRALGPFAHYWVINDCHKLNQDDALEVPVRDLAKAHTTLAKIKDATDAD